MEKLRTLVVDDELGMRLGIRKTLRNFSMRLADIDAEFGFEIDMAETAEEALTKINVRHPDILILDYKLPAMSGLELLDNISVQDSEMVTIMITAFASLEAAVTAVKRGAFDFLAKPFEPNELRSTVKKAAENLLLARHLRKLEKEKRQVRFQFISVLGHELKAPLNAVEGYLEIMNKRITGEKISDYEEMIERSLIRIQGMRKLIYDLLDLTRIESGQKKRELDSVDISEVLQQSVESVLPDAQARQVEIRPHCEKPLLLHCDSGEVEIVLNNLISNAVKYNRDSGEVDIYIDKKEAEVSIRVKDNGIGMQQEDADRLFREFVRIKNDKTKNILGSGLGLSIVKKNAQLYQGEVAVQSQPDKGSEFRVTLKDIPPDAAKS